MLHREVLIDFSAPNAGWTAVTLRVGNSVYTIENASYTTDILGDLLRGALMLVTGNYFARVSFDGEPHEWRLVVSAPTDGISLHTSCSVKVFEFSDISKAQDDNEGRLVFEAECNVGEFATAVLEMARKALNAGGMEAYKWGNWPFPLRAFRALEAAIAAKRPPTSTSI